MAGILGNPFLRGWNAEAQNLRAKQANELGMVQGILGLQNAMRQQQMAEQMNPIKLQLLQEQLRAAQGPSLERVDLGGEIGLLDKRSGQIVGRLPKSITPDTAAREAGAMRRHETPSGSSALGAQVTMRGQDLTDARTRSEGAANRGVTLRGQNMTDQRARDALAQGRIPAGYMAVDGGIAPIPGGPASVQNEAKNAEIAKTLSAYVAARDGLMSGLESTVTGPVAGRIPAVTTGQQIAEGGVSAMAPVLKQLFRVSGEGVFTDRDQQLLLDMVPKRTDSPDARKEKMANIDRIVSAKLGTGVPQRRSSDTPYTGPERRVPAVGSVVDGYKFKGGDPSKPESWEKQ